MSGTPTATALADRRARRTAATRREILDAAWELARRAGLTALSMRDLGTHVGMRAQSLYTYFPSKHSIYDAMFREANEELLARIRYDGVPRDPASGLQAQAAAFLSFCIEDQVRYQLLFQRTIPGFEPSDEAYAPALAVLDTARGALRACGVDAAGALDAWTALTAGLAAQQNANEPGGDRWVRLLGPLTEMFLGYFSNKAQASRRRR